MAILPCLLINRRVGLEPGTAIKTTLQEGLRDRNAGTYARSGRQYPMEPGSWVRFKVLGKETGGAFEAYEREVPPHTIGADPHYHRTTEEFFYIVAGSATILAGKVAKFTAPAVQSSFRHDGPRLLEQERRTIELLITFCPALDHDLFFRGLSELKRRPKETYTQNLAELRLPVRFGFPSMPRNLLKNAFET